MWNRWKIRRSKLKIEGIVTKLRIFFFFLDSISFRCGIVGKFLQINSKMKIEEIATRFTNFSSNIFLHSISFIHRIIGKFVIN